MEWCRCRLDEYDDGDTLDEWLFWDDPYSFRLDWNLKRTLRDSALPLLSIGQMIGFIATHTTELDVFIRGFSNRTWEVELDHGALSFNYAERNFGQRYELCDALWEVVKQVLKEDK